MTAFPEYTKLDVELACKRGKLIVTEQIEEFEKQTRTFILHDLLKRKKFQLETITQLLKRLSDNKIDILTPGEFDSIKQWLPVARVIGNKKEY